MFWNLLVEIGKDLLTSLIVKLVLAVVHAFFDNHCKSQAVRFA